MVCGAWKRRQGEVLGAAHAGTAHTVPPRDATIGATPEGSPCPGTNRGSTSGLAGGTVRSMKPLAIFALWATVGWNAGPWAEAFVGVPSAVGILVGVAIGAALAVEAQRRMSAVADRVRQTAVATSSFEAAPALDRAA